MAEFRPRAMSGRYVYTLGGEPTDIKESFIVTPAGDGCFDIHGKRSAGDGPRLAVEGRLEQGILVKADFAWTDEAGRVEAQFDAAGPAWRVKGRPVQIPPDGLVFGLLRVFTGPLLLAILARGGRAGVVAPQLDASRGLLLEPAFSSREAEVQGGVVLYVGGPYAEAAECRIRPDGLLESYDWTQPGMGAWRVELEA